MSLSNRMRFCLTQKQKTKRKSEAKFLEGLHLGDEHEHETRKSIVFVLIVRFFLFLFFFFPDSLEIESTEKEARGLDEERKRT